LNDIQICKLDNPELYFLTGTDKKLAILLEGESLLNDGAALVFFTVFLKMSKGDYEGSEGVIFWL